MLEVLRTDAQSEHFLDHRREVRQGADRTQRRGVGGPYHPARRRQDQGVFDRRQRHTAFMQLGRQEAVRTADCARRPRCLPVSAEYLLDIYSSRLMGFSSTRIPSQPCSSRSDGPSMVTVWQ